MAFFEKQPTDNTRRRHGRTKIESRERTGSHSIRAAHNKILVLDDEHCPNCHSRKAIENVNTSYTATRYGQIKCTKCSNIIKESTGI
jgi:RNA polymerase subunit RPABC4/transcription elongation factor Spt4